MILPSNELNYELLAFYLDGYLAGVGSATGRKLYGNIKNWHMQQQKDSTPAPWHKYIQLTHKGASEKKLVNLLLDSVEEYFEQNPNWQEDEDIPLRIWFDGENE